MGRRGLVRDDFNPARGIEKYREQGRERFLTAGELARLGDALCLAETEGLLWNIDETKRGAKHLAREEKRRRIIDPFAIAAIRLLVLTGARLSEKLNAKWNQIDFHRGILFSYRKQNRKKPMYLSGAAQRVLAGLPRIVCNTHIIAGTKDAQRVRISRSRGKPSDERRGLTASVFTTCATASQASTRVRPSDYRSLEKLLGRSQPATTQRYAHLDADPLRRAADMIGATIVAAMEKKKGDDIVLIERSSA